MTIQQMLLGASPGTATDPYWSSVVSLLHFDGANGSTTFTDQTGKTWTRTNSPDISTVQSVFGGASGYFQGGGSLEYITTPTAADWLFGSGDFTVEGRSRSDSNTTAGIFGISRTGGTVWPFIIYQSTNNLHFYCSSNGSSWDIASGYAIGTGLTVATWYAWCVERYGNTWSVYLNGTRTNQFTSASAIYSSNPGDIYYGVYNPAGGSSWDGYIDETRVTKGVARYSGAASYTLATAEFPNS